RSLEIEKAQLDEVRKDLNEEYRIMEAATLERLRAALLGQKVVSGKGVKKGEALTDAVLDGLDKDQWFKLRMADEALNEQIDRAEEQLAERRKILDERFEDKKRKLSTGDDLAPGVLKIVKVYLAIKRRIQPGDKMAGRHRNKGAISVIMPVEDMPYDENGQTVDIVLNPLGVPSRMNLGQILDTHLGMAAKGLGVKIDAMLREQRAVAEVRKFLEEIYNATGDVAAKVDLDSFNDSEVLELASNLVEGVPMASPVFDGAEEHEIKALLRL